MAGTARTAINLDTVEKLEEWDKGIHSWNDWALLPKSGAIEPIEGEFELTLSGDAAMHLWRKGPGVWNAWVGRNPRANVDFSMQHFEPNVVRPGGKPLINFPVYRFPKGNVDFSSAKFGDGDVNFDSVTFGDGRVSFWGTTFGDGDVVFINATFGDGDVNFNNATFGDGNVNFSNATFGDGDVNFWGTTFDDGHVDFSYAKLGKGDVDFRVASFGRGPVWFRNLAFDGTARFTGLRQLEDCTQFSFEGCSFAKLFTFSHDGAMGCPLDLRRTSLSHDVVVNDIHCNFELEPKSKWARVAKAANKEDSQRFRKLKELAVANRNHAKALEFHAQEIQTSRGYAKGWWGNAGRNLAQFLYWIASKYGQSVRRPLGWLAILGFVSGQMFWILRKPPSQFSETVRERIGEATPEFSTALTYSLSNMFAFIPTGGKARAQAEDLLFGGAVTDGVIFLNAVQSVLAVMLLFLLGLALRNMFRI